MSQPHRQPARRRPNALRMQLGLLVVLGLLLGAGIIAGHIHHQGPPRLGGTGAAVKTTISGQVVAASNPGCSSGPHGVALGAQVTVLDAAGRVLGVTTLADGTAQGSSCAWSFHLTVTAEARYSVQIADLAPRSVTAAELAQSSGRLVVQDST